MKIVILIIISWLIFAGCEWVGDVNEWWRDEVLKSEKEDENKTHLEVEINWPEE